MMVDTIIVGAIILVLFFLLRSVSWIRTENERLNRAMPNGLHIGGEKIKFGHRWFLDSEDEWHTISCSFDGHTMDFYLDGVLLPTFICMDPDKRHDRSLSISIKVERKEIQEQPKDGKPSTS